MPKRRNGPEQRSGIPEAWDLVNAIAERHAAFSALRRPGDCGSGADHIDSQFIAEGGGAKNGVGFTEAAK